MTDRVLALAMAADHQRLTVIDTLLAKGADPNHRDPEQGLTALQWCRRNRTSVANTSGHDQVEALLAPITAP